MERIAFNLREAAQYLHLAEPTLRALILAGTVPARRLGRRRWLLSKQAIDQWLAGSDVGHCHSDGQLRQSM